MSEEFNFQAWQHSELASALAIARTADERYQKLRVQTRLACKHENVGQLIAPSEDARMQRICLACGDSRGVAESQLEAANGLFRRNVLILKRSEFMKAKECFTLPREVEF